MTEIRETDRHTHNPLVRCFANLGPGLVTGASDDDPSGIYPRPLLYGVFAGAVIAGMTLDLAGMNPIRMLVLSAVLNGLLAPPLLLLVMLVSSNRAIMGTHANGPWLNLFGWSATAVMTLAAVAFFVTS